MKRLLHNVFSLKNENYKKVLRICGIKIKFPNNKKLLKDKIKEIDKINFLLTAGINKEKVLSDIELFKESGIINSPRKPRIIVSLTSYPERMYDLKFCLYSLMNQTLKPDKIILWLSEEEFKNKENDIPSSVLNFKKHGLTIEWCKDNIKSYKKLVPAMSKYPKDIIISADDDLYYPENWLETLYNSYLKYPECINCHRAHKISLNSKNYPQPYEFWEKCIDDETFSFLNFGTTGGGILFPPQSLHKDALNQELFMNLAPDADDIWFWAMSVLNNKKIHIIKNPINQITYTNPARELNIHKETTLFSTNRTRNDIQLQNILEKYPQIKSKLTTYNYAFE